MKIGKKVDTNLRNRTGFTLVELIVAMAFFSFMLTIISFGVVQVMRIYQSGVASRRTQQHARVALEEISRDVRSASNVPAGLVSNNRLCLEGDNTVEYIRTSAHQLQKRVLATSSCPSAVRPIDVLDTTTVIDGDPHNAQLRQFKLQPIFDSDGKVVSVEVVLVVTTGESDLISGDACDPEARGSQFCSATELVGTISLRGSDNETF